jgi:hypothetical protein
MPNAREVKLKGHWMAQKDNSHKGTVKLSGVRVGESRGGRISVLGHCHVNFCQMMRSRKETYYGGYATYWAQVSDRQTLKAVARVFR